MQEIPQFRDACQAPRGEFRDQSSKRDERNFRRDRSLALSLHRACAHAFLDADVRLSPRTARFLRVLKTLQNLLGDVL